MRLKGIFATIGLYVIIASSCGHSGGDIAKIVEERDSLKYEMNRKQRQLANLDTLVSVINHGLDSIAVEEGALFIFNNEGKPDKAMILEKVGVLKDIIHNQKSRIANLERQLEEQKAQGEADAGVTALLAHVKTQLEEKDREIEDLKHQLEKKDVDIANLRQQVGQQSQTIAELNRRTSMQNEALKRQDAMLNYCYMIAAPKKILEQKGIIKNGKIVAQTALDRSKFAKVDIRKFTSFSFEAKKPKILTSMPQSSYSLATDGNGNFLLTITNPTAFWSVSNYLVIQTN